MTPEDLRATVFQALTGVAPEVDPESIKPSIGFREQLDLDSMDFLNFVIALHKRLQVDIPESDYPKLATLDSCMAYLTSHQELQRRK